MKELTQKNLIGGMRLELFRFCIVGGISFLLEYALLFCLTEFAGLYYLYSSAVAFVISLTVNYWLCLKFVFKVKKKQTPKQATIFIGSSVVGLGLNQLCMWIFVELCGIYYMWAKILATLIVTAWNFVMKRKAVRM